MIGGGGLVLGPLGYSPYVNLALPTIVRKLNLLIYKKTLRTRESHYRGSSREAPVLQPISKSGLAYNSQQVKYNNIRHSKYEKVKDLRVTLLRV